MSEVPAIVKKYFPNGAPESWKKLFPNGHHQLISLKVLNQVKCHQR